MKRSIILTCLFTLALASTHGDAHAARKDCDALRAEIATRIESNGVRYYQLQVVEPDAVDVGRIVGSCNGGSRRIAYQRLPGPMEAELPTFAAAPTPLETRAQDEI
ncbi:MAG: DUF1161 domain-containing protein [Aquimonas sp.]|nr:DUF1161 domain-containing protein [Aquimonas sp.]